MGFRRAEEDEEVRWGGRDGLLVLVRCVLPFQRSREEEAKEERERPWRELREVRPVADSLMFLVYNQKRELEMD